jgi:hypothetical protein
VALAARWLLPPDFAARPKEDQRRIAPTRQQDLGTMAAPENDPEWDARLSFGPRGRRKFVRQTPSAAGLTVTGISTETARLDGHAHSGAAVAVVDEEKPRQFFAGVSGVQRLDPNYFIPYMRSPASPRPGTM